MHNKRTLGIAAALIILIILLAVFFLTKQKSDDITINNEETYFTKEFKGEYITAEIPSDWTIKEHTDNQGLRDINNEIFFNENSSMTGLTAIEVIDGNNNPIFKLAGTGGVGGMGGCGTLYLFKDTSENYLDQLKAENEISVDKIDLEIVDLTKEEYSDITILSTRLRRVGNEIYNSVDNASDHFNVKCWWSRVLAFVEIKDLTYGYSDSSYTFHTYYFGLNKNIELSDDTLEKLDKVLNSIKLAK